MRQRPHKLRRRGFTLIEAALVTVIVGVGFMALLQLLAAGTVSNLQGAQTTTGMNLAKNLRELSLKKPFAELMDLDGQSYSPPIDSRGETLSDFDTWTQTVDVQPVDPDRITLDVAADPPEAVRITVTVTQNSRLVCSTSWYAFDGTP
jgi:prepilin-type N-terminal cleavage/methylation domain-containing protein